MESIDEHENLDLLLNVLERKQNKKGRVVFGNVVHYKT